MLAQKFTVSAKATTVVGAPKTAKRGVTIVRRNSKGGEEGARDFGNSAMAMVVKAASYSLLGAAITKVRNYSHRCVPSHARSARASTTGDGAIIARALIHSDATPRAIVRGRSRRRASDVSDAVRRDGWGKIHHSRERSSASRGRARDAQSTRGARA